MIIIWYEMVWYLASTALSDLPDQLRANIDSGSSIAPAQPDDVICLVKRYMCSQNLAQRPLLVMTSTRGNRIAGVPTTKPLVFALDSHDSILCIIWIFYFQSLIPWQACKQLQCCIPGPMFAGSSSCSIKLWGSLHWKRGVFRETRAKPVLCSYSVSHDLFWFSSSLFNC